MKECHSSPLYKEEKIMYLYLLQAGVLRSVPGLPHRVDIGFTAFLQILTPYTVYCTL